MGDKITELTEVVTPDGADVLAVVNGGTTKKITVDNLLAGAGGGGTEITDGDAFVRVAAASGGSFEAGLVNGEADIYGSTDGIYIAAQGTTEIQVTTVNGALTLSTSSGDMLLLPNGATGGTGNLLTQLDGAAPGATSWSPLLTSISAAPGATFETPLWLDTTAVTGGLYAWDGAAYVKVAGAL